MEEKQILSNREKERIQEIEFDKQSQTARETINFRDINFDQKDREQQICPKELLKQKINEYISKNLSNVEAKINKIENKLNEIEAAKYLYFDCSSLLSTCVIDEEVDDLNISYFDKSDILNTTENSNYKALRARTPLKNAKSTTILKERSKTPLKAQDSTTLKSTAVVGIPNNVSKRMEARKISRANRDSTPILEPYTTLKDKSPMIKSKKIEKLEKSPYPLKKNTSNINNNNNALNTSTNLNTSYKKPSIVSSLQSNNALNTSQIHKKTDLDKSNLRDKSNQRSTKMVQLVKEKKDEKKDFKKINTTISNTHRPLNSDMHKEENVTIRTKKNTGGFKVEKEDKDEKRKVINKSQTIRKPLQEEVPKEVEKERSKTPIVIRKKLAKVNKKREISHKGHEILSLIVSKYLLPIERFYLITGSKFLYNDINYWNELIKEKLYRTQNKLTNLEELYNSYLNNPELETLLSGKFTPSKTGKNGLNFVKTEDEINLVTKPQPDEILEFFKVIYILLKENYECLSKDILISNIKNNFFPKYKVDSFSKIF